MRERHVLVCTVKELSMPYFSSIRGHQFLAPQSKTGRGKINHAIVRGWFQNISVHIFEQFPHILLCRRRIFRVWSPKDVIIIYLWLHPWVTKGFRQNTMTLKIGVIRQWGSFSPLTLRAREPIVPPTTNSTLLVNGTLAELHCQSETQSQSKTIKLLINRTKVLLVSTEEPMLKSLQRIQNKAKKNITITWFLSVSLPGVKQLLGTKMTTKIKSAPSNSSERH